MPQELPNLAGVVTKDLIESIGSGNYRADYVNWARTMQLLHQHAPGWCVESIPNNDGGLVHRAPGEGGYLMIQFRHIDGTTTPPVPQAVMDNRNKSIPYEKISSRDVTDTQRRGMCMAAAMTFGLAYELWAKIAVESGYSDNADTAPVAQKAASSTGATKEQFMEAAIARGLTTHSIEALLAALKGKYDAGIKRLTEKDDAWVSSFNEANAPKDNAEQW